MRLDSSGRLASDLQDRSGSTSFFDACDSEPLDFPPFFIYGKDLTGESSEVMRTKGVHRYRQYRKENSLKRWSEP